MIPLEKVKDIINKHSKLETDLSSANIDKKKFVEMSKEYSDLNDIINQEDKRILVAAKDLTSTPTTKDKVVISNVVHQIVDINTEKASGVSVTFTLFVRS